MKIATYNINDVNKRLGNLIGWLRAEKPDVVALQELKAAEREFPKAAIEKAGYGAVWRGQKTWNGVAILARGCEPIVTRRELPGDADGQPGALCTARWKKIGELRVHRSCRALPCPPGCGSMVPISDFSGRSGRTALMPVHRQDERRILSCGLRRSKLSSASRICPAWRQRIAS